MRIRTIALAALVSVLVGCGLPELRQFGQEPAPTPSWIVTFDDTLTAKLPDILPLKQVKEPVSGDITMGKPLNRLDEAWRTYLLQLNDGRIDTHPTHIKAVELKDGQTFGEVCDPGPNHRYPPEMIQPLYCADRDVGDETPAYMVLPHGFTAKIKEFGETNGATSAWLLTSLLAGMEYAAHLRHEMKIAGVMWPDGTAFDYCTVGIGLRTMFPKKLEELEGEKANAVLIKLDQLTSPTEVAGERLGQLLIGYEHGRLEECVV